MGTWKIHVTHVDDAYGVQHIRDSKSGVVVHAEVSKAHGRIGRELSDGVMDRHAVVVGSVDFLEFDLATWWEMAEHGGH
jgi:hypothetical protein